MTTAGALLASVSGTLLAVSLPLNAAYLSISAKQRKLAERRFQDLERECQAELDQLRRVDSRSTAERLKQIQRIVSQVRWKQRLAKARRIANGTLFQLLLPLCLGALSLALMSVVAALGTGISTPMRSLLFGFGSLTLAAFLLTSAYLGALFAQAVYATARMGPRLILRLDRTPLPPVLEYDKSYDLAFVIENAGDETAKSVQVGFCASESVELEGAKLVPASVELHGVGHIQRTVNIGDLAAGAGHLLRQKLLIRRSTQHRPALHALVAMEAGTDQLEILLRVADPSA